MDQDIVDVKFLLLRHGVHIENHLPLALSVPRTELYEALLQSKSAPQGEADIVTFLSRTLVPRVDRLDYVIRACKGSKYIDKTRNQITPVEWDQVFPHLVRNHTVKQLEGILREERKVREYAKSIGIDIDVVPAAPKPKPMPKPKPKPMPIPMTKQPTPALDKFDKKLMKKIDKAANEIAYTKAMVSDIFALLGDRKIEEATSDWKGQVMEELRSRAVEGTDVEMSISEWVGRIEGLYNNPEKQFLFYGDLVKEQLALGPWITTMKMGDRLHVVKPSAVGTHE